MAPMDFASLMEGGSPGSTGRTNRKLKSGQVVDGTVVQIGRDSIFVDVGATIEARIDRAEFEDKAGQLQLKVGDPVRASVVRVDDLTGPVLSTALGRGQRGAVDTDSLQRAKEAGLPVEGTISAVTKGGVEVQVAGIRAFCPASQVELGYVKELDGLVGRTFPFLILEIKDARSIVLSRKALLEKERAEQGRAILDTLNVGGDYEGSVVSVQKYGAFVDLGGGVEGLIHISEMAHGRVDRAEDMVSVGERIRVRVLAMEPAEKGPFPKLRLSMKALVDAPAASGPEPGKVLTGTVGRIESFGVFVDTADGTGLVPNKELGLARGTDARRAFEVGQEVRVVTLVRGDAGKLTFSIGRVAGVEERQNYREFTKSDARAGSLGTFADLLGARFGSPSVVEPEAATRAASGAGSEPAAGAGTAGAETERPEPARPGVASANGSGPSALPAASPAPHASFASDSVVRRRR